MGWDPKIFWLIGQNVINAINIFLRGPDYIASGFLAASVKCIRTLSRVIEFFLFQVLYVSYPHKMVPTSSKALRKTTTRSQTSFCGSCSHAGSTSGFISRCAHVADNLNIVFCSAASSPFHTSDPQCPQTMQIIPQAYLWSSRATEKFRRSLALTCD